MKISQVVPLFFPHIGGVEISVFNLVKKLRELGQDVSVITSDVPPVGSYSISGVKIHRLPVLFRLYDAPFCPSLPIMLSKVRADIIHAHTPPRFFADCVSMLHKLRFSAAPLILTFHFCLENAPSLINAISNFHYNTATPFIFDSCNRIIVPTESYRVLLLKRFGLCTRKIRVIPHGVDLNEFNPKRFEKEVAKKKYGLSSKKVVLFIGRLDTEGAEQKGIRYLLEAVPLVVKEVDDVKFVIGGGGKELERFKDICRHLGISSYVKFIGRFPYGETPSLISTADVFVLPSVFESFGIVLCEAMAMKKPVISTKIRGVVDVVEDGKTGLLVEPRNPKELAHAVLRILSNKNLAERLVKEGRKRVEEKYDWNLIVQKILQIYEECAR